MLSIRLEIGRIDYYKCVRELLPRLVERWAQKQRPDGLERLLVQLGPNAASAVCEILDGMDADARDKLMVWLVGAHEERIRSSADRHLGELLGDGLVRIGRIGALDRPGSGIALLATQVAVDYTALLASPRVADSVDRIGGDNGVLKGAAKLMLKMGSLMSAESLEKQGVSLLNSRRIRENLMKAMEDALRQSGLDIEVKDMSVEIESAGALPETPGAELPDGFGESLTELLRARLSDGEGGN